MTWKMGESVNSVAFSSDGTRIVSGSSDNLVRVWDASTGESLKVLKGHTKSVNSVTFSSDGNRIVSGSSDNSVRVWDAWTGKTLEILEGHPEPTSATPLRNLGSQNIASTQYRALRVEDVSDLTGLVKSAGFSHDGCRIVTGSDDGLVRIWDISTTASRYFRERMARKEYTGWLLSSLGEGYLMYVPPAEGLLASEHIFCIPSSAAPRLDFTCAKFGTEWKECYQPYSNL